MWLRQLFQSTATDQNSIFIYLHESHALAYEECLYPSDSSRYDFTKTPVAPHAGTPQIHNHATAAVRTFLHMRALNACCARRICRQLTTGLKKTHYSRTTDHTQIRRPAVMYICIFMRQMLTLPHRTTPQTAPERNDINRPEASRPAGLYIFFD